MKPTAIVTVNQKEASLLLKLLEASLAHPDTDKNLYESMHRIWDKIFDSGISAGFGAQNENKKANNMIVKVTHEEQSITPESRVFGYDPCN